MLKLKSLPILAGAAALAVTGLLMTGPAQADPDTGHFTSCHLSGGCGTATDFGTVTLNQVGSNVTFDVVLTSGNRFVETGSGGDSLFIFNDSIAGSAITNMSVTFNGATVTEPGGLSGLTNQPAFMADGTGTFTAKVFCTVSSDCNGGSGPDINDLHFTVTNATLAQLETANAAGNIFVADILLGQTGGTGLTGPVDVSSIPAPLIGHGLLVLLAVSGVLSGSKLLEGLKKRHLHAA